ncbi:MAG: 1-deoxy-D-xylulose-5-phosphate reductoisomerase [Acidaminococcaceae bacterium]
MIKNLAVLGSTGSIGKQTLEVALANPEKIRIRALAANTNDELLEQQIKLFTPEVVALSDVAAATRLKRRYCGPTKIVAGDEGLLEVATYQKVDTVLAAMVGYAGLRPTLAAIGHHKNIALANKETLVAAGELVTKAVKKNQVTLLPVDSEHCAIFQALNGEHHKEVKRLIITASGGPFRGRHKSELEGVTLEQCLNHPNWSMGKKITIDSASLANKGLEIIEAHWLFDMEYDRIDVVVHPQSIVHSLVEYQDGSVLAQLGLADMRLPIQYALSYPERWDHAFGQLDLVRAAQLTFEEPDKEAFPALQLAIDCGRAGGTLPCAFNAANEEAVYAFLANKINFLDIPRVIAQVLAKQQVVIAPTLEDIETTDQEARILAKEFINQVFI